jgi:pilus assembly protein CpaE
MLRAICICPDQQLTAELQAALASMPVALVRLLERYPAAPELSRLLRSLMPEVILLSVQDLEAAAEVAREVEAQSPGVQILAVGPASAPDVLLAMMRAGVREFLLSPFQEDAVRLAIFRAREAAKRTPRAGNFTDHVFSFLPSKAGVGTTTTALNISVALAEIPKTSVLLADFDLTSGLIGFMLKLDPKYSVASAAENAFRLDENLWRQLVSSSGALDVLPAGRIEPGFHLDPPQIRSLLDFARHHYQAICLDLSGNLEEYSFEAMSESERIFLVCTSELPSLHLAREKVSYLRSVELEDRVQVILNRSTKHDVVSAGEVEKLLGLPVYAVLPNDYKRVHIAVGL